MCELVGGAGDESSLKQAFLYRMQSPGYQNGSDGDSSSAASSCVNMLRDVQNQFKDRAFRQVQNEFPALREALLRIDRIRWPFERGRLRAMRCLRF